MVEVDVFWSYGIGASFALGAWRQLRKLRESDAPDWGETEELGPDLLASLRQLRRRGKETGTLGKRDDARLRRLIGDIKEDCGKGLYNEYSMKNLAFLSLLFVPSGSVLLWSNPNWETMQVGSYETIPQWLVGLFTTTNVTQGMLGFLVTYHYLVRGEYFKAAMQTVWAYLGFFFILANGWDNTGYRRFFSRNREAFEAWEWGNVRDWITSDVVIILLVYGTVFLPVMYWWIIRWLVEGYYEELGGELDHHEMAHDAVRTFAWLNAVIFGFCAGSAVLSTVLIRKLGWCKGMAAMVPVLALGGSKRLGVGPALMKKVMHVEMIQGMPL